MQKSLALLILVIALSFAIFLPSLNYYFFQDDWFVLSDVINNGPLSLFKFRTDIIYWRPVGMQLFFLLSNKLFNLNPLLFHLAAFAIHGLNIYLIYRLAKNIIKDEKAGLLAAFLYATSSFHFMTLSWLSLSWNLIGLTFVLLSLLSFIAAKKVKSFIFFLLALSSMEFAIFLPVFFFFLNLFKQKETAIKNVISKSMYLLPYAGAIAAYAFLRFIAYPIPASGAYQISLGANVLKEYAWYLLWLLNLPELIRYHLTLSNLNINSDFANPAGKLLIPVLFLFTVQILAIGLIMYKSANTKTIKLLAASIGSFVLLLLPVVIHKDHSYPYYLTLSSIAPVLFLAYLLKKQNNLILMFFLLNWLVLSFLSTQINRSTHWIVGEQSISKKAVQTAKMSYPNLEGAKALYISPSSQQIKLSLMDQLAMKVVYNNGSLMTKFQGQPDEKHASNELPVLWNK